ncbi:hypothetical protein ACWT_0532 [Actinoplanes sp. SE50]|nr:hypothetical protein ACPL_648 [Actinoplanes sp. SE50/110]ATO79947.1 hypothetical protein ACWT_0532 [Actinoplanes sp. SE50]SLL97349.1 uncharacterized protein ACSP50_0550 [Actinoplanes sp. SE50/110]
MLKPGAAGRIGAMQPVTEAVAPAGAGVSRLTRARVAMIDDLARARWQGRCAVLHEDAGNPSGIYFWGLSGEWAQGCATHHVALHRACRSHI